MNDMFTTPWRVRLLDWLLALVTRWRYGAGWTLLPISDEDMPVAIVEMDADAYDALVLYGYSQREGEEVDWSLEPPYDMPDEAMDAARREGLEAMRDVLRRHIVEWKGMGDE